MAGEYLITGWVLQKSGDSMPQVVLKGEHVKSRSKQERVGHLKVGLFAGKIDDTKTGPLKTAVDFHPEDGFRFVVKDPGWYTVLLFHKGDW